MVSQLVARTIRRRRGAIWTDKTHTLTDYLIATINYKNILWAPLSVMDLMEHNIVRVALESECQGDLLRFDKTQVIY